MTLHEDLVKRAENLEVKVVKWERDFRNLKKQFDATYLSRSKVAEERDAALEQVKVLREALKWYADEDSYLINVIGHRGQKARDALAAQTAPQEDEG